MGRNTLIPGNLLSLNDQIEVTPSGEDRGVCFDGQVCVTEEIVAGEDSYPVPLAFHCTLADTIDTTIINATDVTEILQSDSESTTGLLNGVSTGNYILVGSKQQFEGVKLKISDSGNIEPNNIIAEAYADNIIAWTDIAFMATNSDYPHESRAWNICYEGDTSEHIFFGFNPLTRYEDSIWLQNTFTINGTLYEDYYWARLRITTDITEDATIEQIKLHTDRTEYESTGIFKYGKARNPILLTSGITSLITNAQEDPANRDIEYTNTFTADTINNRLQHNRDDGVGIVVTRRFGLDTSVPLLVDISYYVDGSDTGVVEWVIKGSQINDGYTYDGTNTSEYYTVTDTITEDSDLVRRTVRATVPINTLESDSAVLIEISRLGSSSSVDTLSDDVVITNVALFGYVWKI